MESDKSYSYFFSQLSDRKSSTIHSSSNKTLSLSTNQNSSSNNSTTVQETFQYPLIQVEFRWKDPAEAVYLTGNFCNWKQKFLMPKVDNEFLLVLKLQEGTYQYKFIVDGAWQCSKYDATYNDNGMINNILEVKYHPEQVKNVQKENIKTKGDGYGMKKEGIIMQKIPNRCNEQYMTYVKNDNKDILSKVNESYSRKVLPFVNHIYVNHLMTGEKNLRGKVMHLSFTKRIRSKFVTIIYYDCKKDNRKIQ